MFGDAYDSLFRDSEYIKVPNVPKNFYDQYRNNMHEDDKIKREIIRNPEV